MVYFEVTYQIPAKDISVRELAIAELSVDGFESFLETDESLLAFIPASQSENKRFSKYQFLSEPGYKSTPTIRKIEEQNWNLEWQKIYHPVSVGNFCNIRTMFHKPKNGYKHEIIIQPQMSFGTGHHDTTWLMIKSMEAIDFSNKKVLDIGSGTGILSILSSLMGANQIVAYDIDNWAYQNSCSNIELNNIINISVNHGSIDSSDQNEYDIILANISKNVILNDISEYKALLRKGGNLIISGFYNDDLDEIIAGADSISLNFSYFNEKNRWVAALFIKQGNKNE